MNKTSMIYNAKKGYKLAIYNIKIIVCLLALPGLLVMLWIVVIQAICIWLFRCLRHRKNLLPELKRRVLSSGKLW